jgi:hypothetical protein
MKKLKREYTTLYLVKWDWKIKDIPQDFPELLFRETPFRIWREHLRSEIPGVFIFI